MINDEAILRSNAKAFLPRELDFLAKAYGFKYTQVKIRKSRTRWGSCSSKGIINLSFYLMLLPPHLIRYVLLHELCHTVEMNHGPAFWALLDKYTDGEAKKLRREMKNYRIP
jgi:predicted metal-dependent hydrolase